MGGIRDATIEAGDLPGADQGLLYLVLGIVDRAEYAVAVRHQLIAERAGETGEFLAARLCAGRG